MRKPLKWGNKKQIYYIYVLHQKKKKKAVTSYQCPLADKDCLSEPLLNCLMTQNVRIKILVFFPTGKYFAITRCDLTFEICQLMALSRKVKFLSMLSLSYLSGAILTFL